MNSELTAKFGAGRDGYLDLLGDLVRRETPSRDKRRCDAFARHFADLAASGGVAAETVANPDGGDHLRLRSGPRDAGSSGPALILAHYDTVWPAGTVEARPFARDGRTARGPGVYDMKASLLILLLAIEDGATRGLPRPVEVLVTSDEEVGSPTSRALIEEAARRASYVLVLEPPLPDGSLKTARKGVGGFSIKARGRAAHAGVEPEKGASAIVELAYQIMKVQQLGDPSRGTTLNVGTIEGGTAANVVPERASCRVDVRASTIAEAERVEAAIRASAPIDPRVSLHVTGGFNRPPMERTPAVAALFERALQIARALGMELTEGSTGGGSDGNFTAALGVPTLDGLGALGGGAHAEDEHVLIDSIPERAALLAALLHSL